MAKSPRRRFSREFKLEAVRLANQEGVPVAQVARDLGIGDSVLRRWMKQYEEKGAQAFGGSGHVAPKDEEMDADPSLDIVQRALRREHAAREIAGYLGDFVIDYTSARISYTNRYQ